jgi:2-polyprenyl-3-methyl-5-hydroxy-6-metoxy-1,4-benzoquinol methylase
MDENQIRDELKKYNFYHVIKLTENIFTPGWKDAVAVQEVPLRALRSLDLKNKRVLDIGCRDGLFCFEAEKLGAGEVIGIDNNLSLGAVNFLIPYFQSNVKMYELNVLDLKPETFGKFDIVIFPGVLYHLRYPFWALKLIKDVLHEGGQLIIETAIFMDDNKRAILFCPIGSESPYEPTSCTFFNIKGISDTLLSLDIVVQKTELFYAQERPKNTSFLSTIKSRLKSIQKASQPVEPYIERATLVCRKQSKNQANFEKQYWDSTHQYHTYHLM